MAKAAAAMEATTQDQTRLAALLGNGYNLQQVQLILAVAVVVVGGAVLQQTAAQALYT